MDLVTFSKLSLFCLVFLNNSLSAVLKKHQIHSANNRVNAVATRTEIFIKKIINSILTRNCKFLTQAFSKCSKFSITCELVFKNYRLPSFVLRACYSYYEPACKK